MTVTTRRSLLTLAATLGLAALATPVLAQGAWPSRPSPSSFRSRPAVRPMPSPASWPSICRRRLDSSSLSRTSSAPAAPPAPRAPRATPDGYTLITGHMGTHAASVALYPDLQYHPEKDFEPVGLLAGTPILILAKKDFPATDLKGFVEQVKANSTKMNQAHAGVGSVSHISCILLNSQLGAKPVGIPFNGTGPAMNALIAGQIDYMCDQIVNAVPQIQSGTIKAFAVATPERNPSLPNLPTTKEAGLPSYQASAWNALFAPKGTPEADPRQGQ